jgi:hypothetical protein
MGGLAPYDCTKADNSDILATLHELSSSRDDFQGTRHPDYSYLLIGGTMTLETIHRSGKQSGSYEFVEPACYNGVTAFTGRHLPFYLFNHSLPSPKTFHSRKTNFTVIGLSPFC